MTTILNRFLTGVFICWFCVQANAQTNIFSLKIPKDNQLEIINKRLNDLTYEVINKEDEDLELFSANYLPVYSDSIYAKRLAKLNSESPIVLDFKPIVRNYIEAYAIKHKDKTARVLGRSEHYFPIFEEYLDKYQLPLELKYLAVIESALVPNARSKSGALGLWQFMYNSSKMFDLKITSYIDERLDPEKATDAACRYLQYLYRIFGDWHLAIAAYNGGPGAIRDAIQKSGGKTNFWEISPFLPDQTRKYVPAFIAVNYIVKHHKKHNIIAKELNVAYFNLGSVKVKEESDLKVIAKKLNMNVGELRNLNPVYKKDMIPSSYLPAKLILPISKIGLFIDLETEIYKDKRLSNLGVNIQEEVLSIEGKYCIIHKVGKGEYFHKIAMKYSCTLKAIRNWNNLKDNRINEGQRLKIWIKPELDTVYLPFRDFPAKKIQFLLYEVESGDSFESIADRYEIDSIDNIKKINGFDDDYNLRAGIRIKLLHHQ